MAFSEFVKARITAAAKAADLPPAALLAVAEVESEGRAFAIVDGEARPLILYEFHVFDRNLPAPLRAEARATGLAAARWGALSYPRTQRARWRLLERASRINAQAAHAAVSWGVGQVLGENAAWLGYGKPTDLAAEAMRGIDGQIGLMLRFIEKRGLADEIERRDWRGVARLYNGPGQVDDYSARFARAYARHGGAPVPAPAAGMLRLGSEGPRVRVMQRMLASVGAEIAADGDFGPATRAAVIEFQRGAGLAADGIAGPKTLGALQRAAYAAARVNPAA